MLPNKSTNKRVLSVFSLAMINVIAVDSLRTLPIAAEYGFSLVFYYLLAAFAFFIPIALIAAELATGWPETGGLYVWVREAFGRRWGFFTIYLQWIYNVVWYPTILAFMAAALAQLFAPQWANDPVYLLFAVLIIFWLATFINFFGMRISSMVSILGALLGTLLPMILIIILGMMWIKAGKPTQIQFTWDAFWPNTQSLNHMVFFVAVLFGLIGMEMSAVHAEEVRDPQRDYPRALLYSGALIFGSLVLASLAIAVVIPTKKLSLVSGLVDAFHVFFSAYHMDWMNPVIVVLIVLGGVCGVSAWVIGPTKGLLEAARDGCMPERLARVNRYGVPVTILLVQGVIGSLLSGVFVILPTVNASYWLLSALTAQLALIVYIMMFAAFIQLRYSQAKRKRAYTVPGGNSVAWLLAGLAILTCLGAIIIGFFPPSEFTIGSLWLYELLLVLGILIFCVIPFILFRFAHRDLLSKKA